MKIKSPAQEPYGAPLRTLFPPQRQLLDRGFLDSNQNWVICAPTGSGKTLMAEWAIEQTLNRGQTAIYIAPLRAIVEEKAEEWRSRHGLENVGLFTGETTKTKVNLRPGKEHLLVMTPEKLSSYLMSWKRHLDWLSRVGLVVIDEFHVIGDTSRGAGIEAMLVRFQRINPFCRFLGMSGTLSNADQLAGWMSGQTFESDWRPIPLAKSERRFKTLNHKYGLLLEEVRASLDEGGKVLVFVNSRKRAESLTKKLQGDGVSAEFHHAGLPQEIRMDIHSRLRAGGIDVMLSTSALEMGVNFPVRKVIVHDAYCFDGASFASMSIQRFQQCAGRAGRPGFDTKGEVCLFLPCWDAGRVDYLNGEPEPVQSAMFRKDALLREILGEVSSRLSISDEHLEVNFASRTLWRNQGGQQQLFEHLDLLKKHGLIKETQKQKRTYLSDTPLGRIATQMALSPGTIILWARLHKSWDWLDEFDILLAACLAPEATPVLGFNFEEMDHMGDQLLESPSAILDTTWDVCRERMPELNAKRMLAGIKAAVILKQHTNGETLEDLAPRYDCYATDLFALKQNIVWLLAAAQRTFHVLDIPRLKEEFGDDDETPLPESASARTCRDLGLMIEYGVPHESVGLVQIPGIGTKRAATLLKAGVRTIPDLVRLPVEHLANELAIKPATASKMLDEARRIQELNNEECPFGDGQSTPTHDARTPSTWNWPKGVDPYRLRRSFELRITHCSEECVRVEGGSEPHQVKVNTDALRRRAYACDCHDFAKGHTLCKHIIRARLELNDDAEILSAIRLLQDQRGRPLRHGLGELWMRVSDLFDRFTGREVDYAGAQFLRKASEVRR